MIYIALISSQFIFCLQNLLGVAFIWSLEGHTEVYFKGNWIYPTFFFLILRLDNSYKDIPYAQNLK